MKTGIDHLLADLSLVKQLKNAKVGLIAHPASITSSNLHSLDALCAHGCNIVKTFGPQHGMRGDKQDNMIESVDYLDPIHQIPVISLYGEHRFPTNEMIEDLDIILFDLQDVGCRIYTYITTLKYFVDACAENDCELWVLDRPNPAGRPIDGLFLEAGEESFVGCEQLPTRHGLTVAELASWFNSRAIKPAKMKVVKMRDYHPESAPGYGWPLSEHPWVNPSPNAASLNMARCFAGTVLLEGTTLSEGRGTTTPLEVIGAPNLPIKEMLEVLTGEAAHWLSGAYLRPCFFEPTFHKHVAELCAGLQIHTDHQDYQHRQFKPYRLIAGLLKALRQLQPDFDLWRDHPYEYELDRKPIDVINGGAGLRKWVDDPQSSYSDMDALLMAAEEKWAEQRQEFLIYR